jgi:hypothetical protein
MAATSVKSGSWSLATWLARLEPGDPCPLCGAPLEVVISRAGTTSSVPHVDLERGQSDSGCPQLVCRLCGFEEGVCEMSGGPGHGLLETAA